MSIFVSVASLEDTELINTLTTAVENADDPSSISVGLALTTKKSYYKNFLENLPKQVAVKWFNSRNKNNIGVGLGRSRALSLYNNQDYVLQVDAHTHFEKGWDTTLKNWLHEATELTGNPKTMLTTFPPQYRIDGTGERERVLEIVVPYFLPGFLNETRIPRWSDTRTHLLPRERRPKGKFLPGVKFQAAFVFTYGKFAKESGVYQDAIFMDEELTQSMTLMAKGWTFVVPNQVLPISHLYQEHAESDGGNRLTIGDLKDKKVNGKNMTISYYRFINDPANAEGVRLFSEYNRVHPKYGSAQQYALPPDFFRP